VDPRSSHPPHSLVQQTSVLVEDVQEEPWLQPVLQPMLEPDEICRMFHLIQEQGRLIEEFRAEKRKADLERANQPPPNAQPLH
jgi:hypothetical protein